MAPLPLPLLLTATALAGEGPVANSIYPGLERTELQASVDGVIGAMKTCMAHGLLVSDLRAEPTAELLLAASKVDGRPVFQLKTRAVWDCDTAPVDRCQVVYAWDANGADVHYAQLECIGSADSADDVFTLTASIDVDKRARRHRHRPRGAMSYSVSFSMSGFPTIQATLFTQVKRANRSVLIEPTYHQFDAYKSEDTGTAEYTAEQVVAMTRQVSAAARAGVQFNAVGRR